MTESALLEKFDQLVSAVIQMARVNGARLTREQLAARMGAHKNTIRNRMERDTGFPRPCADGKWLLSDVIEWEMQR